ncbi:MAG: DNA primase, partial [Rikenellaceae bacterium]|nr:DNA primase [Rikenellaceae bacterium]
MIDPAIKDKIFAVANIVEVVSDFVTLKKRGVNYIACCPFHNEKTPSFVVSPAKGVFKCFGCGKAGNAV